MGQLLVSNPDQEVIQALQRMAAANGRSVEAEHRAILRSHLLAPPNERSVRSEGSEGSECSFKQALADMPYFNDDDLFDRR